MARVIKRVAVKRDLTDHFVFLGENASLEVARRFLHACNVSFQALAQMPELGAQRSFRNPRFSSVRAWPVKGLRAADREEPAPLSMNLLGRRSE